MSYYANNTAIDIADSLAGIADGLGYCEYECEDLSAFADFANEYCEWCYDESPNFDYYVNLACGNVDGVSTSDVFADALAALSRLRLVARELSVDWSSRYLKDEVTVLEAIAEWDRFGLEKA